MRIAGRKIGTDEPPYIVAEVSCNHMGSPTNALELIDHAKRAGADAVKFQHYTPEMMTLDCDGDDFIIEDGACEGRRLFDLYKQSQTPPEWFPELFAEAQKRDITAFASVFSCDSVDALEKLGCPAYKIASMEIVDLPLIRYVAETKKPIILSTGMASGMEILDACVAARGSGSDIVLLHCVSGYPTMPKDANLGRLKELARIGFPVGISDHTKGNRDIPIAAVAMGACIIERHLMLAGTEPLDVEFSSTASEFAGMITRALEIWLAMQESHSESEVASRQLRRSLYVTRDIAEGEALTGENIRSIRPGYGLPPKQLGNVMGKLAVRAIQRGTPLGMDLIR